MTSALKAVTSAFTGTPTGDTGGANGGGDAAAGTGGPKASDPRPISNGDTRSLPPSAPRQVTAADEPAEGPAPASRSQIAPAGHMSHATRAARPAAPGAAA